MRTFAIITLGCKVNQYESEAIAMALTRQGLRPAGAGEQADLCIVNTCTVTGRAAMQSRQAIRRAGRLHPAARIVATGCYAQIDPRALGRIEGVAAVVGHQDKLGIAGMLDELTADNAPPPLFRHGPVFREHRFVSPPSAPHGARSRPFVKIQDGCDAFCTYCIVPRTRGRSRSMPLEKVLEHIAELGRRGYREVVLTGIHLGQYGVDLHPSHNLASLLRRIRSAALIERVRLSSLEPHEITDELLAVMAEASRGPGRICNHLHAALQSGDDRILKRMHRPYTAAFFRELVGRICSTLPGAAVGADVLIGFPGETTAAFENTRALLGGLPLSYLHVFPFSPRRGTPAFYFSDRVADRTITKRSRIIRELGWQKKSRFYRQNLNMESEVLIMARRAGARGDWEGISSNYLKVYLKAEGRLHNRLATVRLSAMEGGDALRGELVEGTAFPC